MKYFLITISLLICCNSCTEKVDEVEAKKKVEDVLQFTIPKIKYINNYRSDYAFTSDYIESFELGFQIEDFEDLLKLFTINSICQTSDLNNCYLTKKSEREIFSIIVNKEQHSLKYTYIYE